MNTPSDNLEAQAFKDASKPCIETCHECGSDIETEQESYWVSRDGERFCCSGCDRDITRLSSIKYSNEWGGFAECGRGIEFVSVEVRARSQVEALKQAEDYGEIINEGVNAYVEVV